MGGFACACGFGLATLAPEGMNETRERGGSALTYL